MKNKHRRKIRAGIMCGVGAAILSGCSINPTPTAFFGLPINVDVSNDIVHRTRCEARDAMIRRAAELLNDLNTPLVEYVSQDRGRQDSGAIAKELLADPSKLQTYKEWQLPPLLYIIASPILRSQLAMDFTFTITENNDDTFSPELTSNVGSNTFTLGITSHELDRERQNLRKMPVAARNFDTFQTLSCEDDGEEKNKRAKTNKKTNFNYPLKGNIQLYKTISTFIDFVFLDVDRDRDAEGKRTLLARNTLTNTMRPFFATPPTIVSDNASGPKADRAHRKALNKLRQITADLNSTSCPAGSQCDKARACYGDVLENASDA